MESAAQHGVPPAGGEEIRWHPDEARLEVPARPIVAFIEGDGTGPDIWRATKLVLDGAVARCYGGSRAIAWTEILAGEKAHRLTGSWLPDETLAAIERYRVAIKGPLTTPVGGGIRSLNVTLRQVLDLYAEELAAPLGRIQNELFHLGSDLCVLEEDKARMPVPVVEERHVAALEGLMDRLSEELPPLANFILPGGAPGAAQLHVARTVCRRAERLLVTLAREEPVGAWAVRYLNRLSDALFVMARFENLRRGVPEPLWDSRA